MPLRRAVFRIGSSRGLGEQGQQGQGQTEERKEEADSKARSAAAPRNESPAHIPQVEGGGRGEELQAKRAPASVQVRFSPVLLSTPACISPSHGDSLQDGMPHPMRQSGRRLARSATQLQPHAAASTDPTAAPVKALEPDNDEGEEGEELDFQFLSKEPPSSLPSRPSATRFPQKEEEVRFPLLLSSSSSRLSLNSTLDRGHGLPQASR